MPEVIMADYIHRHGILESVLMVGNISLIQ